MGVSKCIRKLIRTCALLKAVYSDSAKLAQASVSIWRLYSMKSLKNAIVLHIGPEDRIILSEQC
jgi:hypothetical protein